MKNEISIKTKELIVNIYKSYSSHHRILDCKHNIKIGSQRLIKTILNYKGYNGIEKISFINSLYNGIINYNYSKNETFVDNNEYVTIEDWIELKDDIYFLYRDFNDLSSENDLVIELFIDNLFKSKLPNFLVIKLLVEIENTISHLTF